MTLPSKELISEVLGADVTSISIISEREIKVHGTEIWDEVVINIYELQQLIKDWLHNNKYAFDIKYPTNCHPHEVTLMFCGEFEPSWSRYHIGHTEFEAVVKAGEWVLVKMEDSV